MIVFITTGYGKNVIGGADLWCNNFIENILPLVKEDYKIVIDGRALIKEFGAIYTYENEKEVDKILNECDKIIFLHHSYKQNPIIKNYLHKTYLTFVHAFIPDMLGLNSDYENIMTKVDWEWQKEILDNSDNIIWIGYEKDTIHNEYPKTKTITNYYEWKHNKPFTGIITNKIGYAARCETRKNAHYLDSIPSIIFSNKYDYKRMLEGSNTNSDYHRFMEFDYTFHNKFFEGNFQIFHGCYTKEPFGYAIFDAVDNGKVPIIHTDWMKHIDYKYRANSKEEFQKRYLEIQEDEFEKINLEFCKLRDGLTKYTNKQNWIKKICSYLMMYL
jgi:hypothetical protein